jgi:hypothetical protein
MVYHGATHQGAEVDLVLSISAAAASGSSANGWTRPSSPVTCILCNRSWRHILLPRRRLARRRLGPSHRTEHRRTEHRRTDRGHRLSVPTLRSARPATGERNRPPERGVPRSAHILRPGGGQHMTGWRSILPMPVSVRVTGGDRRNHAPAPGFPWHNPQLPSDRSPARGRSHPLLATADAKNPSTASCHNVPGRGTIGLDRTGQGVETP